MQTMTPTPILHHYPNSPFSEKIRAIFGYKQLKWQSVLIPVILPKPDLVALTGGYRRTPVMQIGSDIYCDTALICEVVESLAPSPTLYPTASENTARILAQWADTTLFWTVIAYCFQPEGLAEIFKGSPPEALQAFMEDRKAFRAGAARMHPAEATASLKIYLNRLAGILAQGMPYLCGNALSIADFSVYHCLWYIRRAGAMAQILDTYPQLLAWMEKIAALGHGTSERISSEQAIVQAHNTPLTHFAESFPLSADAWSIALGQQVTVAPSDYGADPVTGTLVISEPNHVAVQRTDRRAGEVTVHFPRVGFIVKKN